ncbi:MAG: hypothetical protein NUW02_01685 [Candidatus Campbellbacteria bacterium]|nr:hypothetical protein [Candidatus Campbellbacteria bacterium]
MRESMLGRIVVMIVTVPAEWLGMLVDLLEKLLGKAGAEWFTALGRFLRKEEVWSGKKNLLRFLFTSKVAGSKKFVAKDAFRINMDLGQRTRISHLGENFKRQFLSKVEENVDDTTLCLHELLKTSRDIPIVAELGNEEGVEIFLAHFCEVLAVKQAVGNLTLTVSYVRDKDDVLCAVFGEWLDSGWIVEADYLGSPDRWGQGICFVSRLSPACADMTQASNS